MKDILILVEREFLELQESRFKSLQVKLVMSITMISLFVSTTVLAQFGEHDDCIGLTGGQTCDEIALKVNLSERHLMSYGVILIIFTLFQMFATLFIKTNKIKIFIHQRRNSKISRNK